MCGYTYGSAEAPTCCIDWLWIASPHYDNPGYRAVSVLQAYGQMVATGVMWARLNIDTILILLPRFSKKEKHERSILQSHIHYMMMNAYCMLSADMKCIFHSATAAKSEGFCDDKKKRFVFALGSQRPVVIGGSDKTMIQLMFNVSILHYVK